MSILSQFDPAVADAIRHETERQEYNLELIASENFVSEAVLEAQGSIMTNKYAEGYPGKRYYGGCEHVDVVEQLAIDRAKELFGAEHANVQPHSGSQANMAVYFAACKPGDTILGMNLSHGGHLTHGSPVNFSGKLFNIVPYGVSPETETIDYDEVERLAVENKPKMIVVGASAYPRIIDFPAFRAIADKVGAVVMVDMAHIAGLVAAGVHPSPVPYAEFVTTTTHKTLRGPRGGMILCREEFAKTLNSQIFPGIQGGPLMHVIAAKAVAFKEALQPEFKAYQQQIVNNAKALAAALTQQGFQADQRRHRQPPDADQLLRHRDHRQGGRRGPGQGRHHGQQEYRPVRDPLSVRHLRHPHRHTGLHVPWPERGGDGTGGRFHRRCRGQYRQ